MDILATRFQRKIIDENRSVECKHPLASEVSYVFLHCYRCGCVFVDGKIKKIAIKTEANDNEDNLTRNSSYLLGG